MEVEAMVRPVVEAAGLELVEIAFARDSGRRVLRVTVDRDPAAGALDLELISEVSERINRRLDLEGYDPLGGPYSLEVSSPGVERPLRQPRDFARRVGEKVRVRARDAEGGVRVHTGTLLAATPETVTLRTEEGERTVRFEDIGSARTVFEWGPRGRPGKGARSPTRNDRASSAKKRVER